MGRPKGSTNKSKTIIKTKLTEPIRKKCLGRCGKEKLIGEFYKSNNPDHTLGVYEFCKDCVRPTNIDDINEVKRQLHLVNRPFINKLWSNSLLEAKKKNWTDVARWGNYLKNIQLRGSGYEFATYEDSEEYIPVEEGEVLAIIQKSKLMNDASEIVQEVSSLSADELNELTKKWGKYPEDELVLFEDKYQLLKENYPERTQLHIESLQTYVRYRVKEELATQKGDADEAKKWADLAAKQATAAKINPSQLSKADLSDGLDSFSQLVRNVEQAVDVIEILPKFKERPKDKVDFTIWCYINYIRDLKGLPPCEYKEVYQFYEQRKKDYEAMIESDEDGIL